MRTIQYLHPLFTFLFSKKKNNLILIFNNECQNKTNKTYYKRLDQSHHCTLYQHENGHPFRKNNYFFCKLNWFSFIPNKCFIIYLKSTIHSIHITSCLLSKISYRIHFILFFLKKKKQNFIFNKIYFDNQEQHPISFVFLFLVQLIEKNNSILIHQKIFIFKLKENTFLTMFVIHKTTSNSTNHTTNYQYNNNNSTSKLYFKFIYLQKKNEYFL